MNSLTFPQTGFSAVNGPDISPQIIEFSGELRDAFAVYCRSLMEIGRISCEFGIETIEDGNAQMRNALRVKNPLEAGSLCLSFWQRQVDRSTNLSRDSAIAAVQANCCLLAPQWHRAA